MLAYIPYMDAMGNYAILCHGFPHPTVPSDRQPAGLRSKGIPPLKDALINEPEDHLKAGWDSKKWMGFTRPGKLT